MIDPLHARLAMAALNMGTPAVGEKIGVHGSTVRAFCRGKYSVASSTVAAMEKFFQSEGIVFLEGPDGLGIRVKAK